MPFDVEERRTGTTKWSFRKLFRFAFDGITSFSTVPLRVWTYLGGLISLCGALAVAELAGSMPHTGGWYVQVDASAKYDFNTDFEFDKSFSIR